MRALNEHVDKLNAMIGACCDEGLTQEMRSAVSAAQAEKASIYAEPSQDIMFDLSRQRERFHKRLSDKAGAGAGAGARAGAGAGARAIALAAAAASRSVPAAAPAPTSSASAMLCEDDGAGEVVVALRFGGPGADGELGRPQQHSSAARGLPGMLDVSSAIAENRSLQASTTADR